MAAGLADRLLGMLRQEMTALEKSIKDNGPSGEGEGVTGTSKGRFEAISQMTKTLEKLLDLKRLERLVAEGESETDAAETRRLADELMRRLKALDARRRAGASLFAEPAQSAGEAR